MKQFNKTYFFLFIILLIIEISIALYISEGFIRHTFGDVIVVILIYCFLKSVVNIRPIKAVAYVLVFAFIIELFQLTSLLEYLQLSNSELANIVLGNTFSVSDLVAYTIGAILILFFEHKFSEKGIYI